MQAQAKPHSPATVTAPRFRATRGGLLMLVGGILVIAGSLWPWYDRLNPDLTPIPIETDKTLILMAGLLLALCSVLLMHDRRRFGPLSILGGGAAVASMILLLRVALDVQTYFPKPIDLTAVLDWWYWGAMLGAFVGVAGAWSAFHEKPLEPGSPEEAHAALPAKQRAGLWAKKNWLIAPAVIYAIIITQGPFIVTIWYSLQKWNLLRPENSRFNGLQNYADLLVGTLSSDFRNALINTIVLTAAAVLLSLLLGLLFAELVNSRFPGRGIVRTMLITPFLVMPVVAALGWKNMMLNPVFGVVDWVITSLGGPRIDWFTDYPMLSIIVIVVWRWAPFMMIIMLAGMQALSDEVREAGRVDGASGRQEFRFIVLPHLKPFMQLCLLFGVIYIFAEFDSIAMTTQGGPGDKTLNLPYLIYRTVFYANDVGHAAAMGVMLVALTFVFATYLIRMLGRLMEGSQG